MRFRHEDEENQKHEIKQEAHQKEGARSEFCCMSSYAAALIGIGEKSCNCDETIVIVFIIINLDCKDSNEVGEAWNHGVQVPQVLCGQVQG